MMLYDSLDKLEQDVIPIWKPYDAQLQQENYDTGEKYGLRGNIPQADLFMSTNEYFDTALNGADFSDRISQGMWQYNKHSSLAVLNNFNIETYVNQNYVNDLTPEMDIAWWHCSTPHSKFISIGILYDPVNIFLKNLKFDNNLVTNITGHYRGTYMVGKHYLLDLLKNSTAWWLDSQAQQFERHNIDMVLREDIVYNTTRKQIDNFCSDIDYDCGIRSMIGMLHKKQGSVYKDTRRFAHWGRMPHTSKFNHWLERHLMLEESAWTFMKDPEVWTAFVERYADDFKLGNFLSTPRTTSWADYQIPRSDGQTGVSEIWV